MATVNDTVVLFGGVGGTSPNNLAYLNDTWTWNGSSWTQQTASGPSIRGYYGMASATDSAPSVILFGGFTGVDGQDRSDTWFWTGANWSNNIDIFGPSGREDLAMAALNGSVVLFGGCGSESGVFSDTWVFDGTRWSQANGVGPTARCYPAMASW